MAPLLSFLLVFLFSFNVLANDAQAEIEDFIQQNLQTPVKKAIWLTGDKKTLTQNILGHAYPKLRLAYWQDENARVFILEEIGKTLPITVGILIRHQKIQLLQVLKFRETRGWEVKLKTFTDQFNQVSYQNENLSSRIDGISGATLSVRAVTKLSKLALALNQTLEP